MPQYRSPWESDSVGRLLEAGVEQPLPDQLRDVAVGIWGGTSGPGVAVEPVVGGAETEGLSLTWSSG